MNKVLLGLVLSLVWYTNHLTTAHAQNPCLGRRFSDEIFRNVRTRNVTYGRNVNVSGNSQTLTMDIYEPEGDTLPLRPVIFWAFGGSFTAGIRQSPDIVRLAQTFARKGYVCVSIDYRLGTNGESLEEAVSAVVRGVHDGKAAVRWLRKHAVEDGNTYRIDTAQIFFGGVSAGGFIALHMAYMDSYDKLLQLVDTTGFTTRPGLQGDLEGASGNPGYSSHIKGVINLCGAIGSAQWIDPGDEPVISLHGTEDGTVPYARDEVTALGNFGLYVDGSYVIDSVARARGVASYLYTWPGLDHVPFIRLDVTEILLKGLFDEVIMDTTVNYITRHLFKYVDQERLSPACRTATSRPTLPSESAWEIFPNPSTGAFYVRLPEGETPRSLTLMDALGRSQPLAWVSESDTRLRVQLPEPIQGLTTVTITTDTRVRHARLVIGQ
jgi:hypothetical protein